VTNLDARTATPLVVFAGHTQPILTMAVKYTPALDTVFTAGDDMLPRLFQADVAEDATRNFTLAKKTIMQELLP